MIDMILRAGTKPVLATFLRARNLTDADNNPREGVELCWWAESGKIMSAKAVMSGDTVVSPATFLPGVALLCRIHGQRFTADQLAEGPETWQRSAIAKWLKTNGTPGTAGGISYYEIENVRLFRAADVAAWLAANDLPGHQWAGGNSF